MAAAAPPRGHHEADPTHGGEVLVELKKKFARFSVLDRVRAMVMRFIVVVVEVVPKDHRVRTMTSSSVVPRSARRRRQTTTMRLPVVLVEKGINF